MKGHLTSNLYDSQSSCGLIPSVKSYERNVEGGQDVMYDHLHLWPSKHEDSGACKPYSPYEEGEWEVMRLVFTTMHVLVLIERAYLAHQIFIFELIMLLSE